MMGSIQFHSLMDYKNSKNVLNVKSWNTMCFVFFLFSPTLVQGKSEKFTSSGLILRNRSSWFTGICIIYHYCFPLNHVPTFDLGGHLKPFDRVHKYIYFFTIFIFSSIHSRCSKLFWKIWQLIELGSVADQAGRPLMTATDESNPWWAVFKRAVSESGGKLAKPEILSSTTDARFMRQLGIPTLGFSPMANTPVLLHEHNEVPSPWSILLLMFLLAPLLGSPHSSWVCSQFLQDTVFLKGIEVYKHVIRSLSTFMESSV